MKTILITGASAGIGRSTAKIFASRGWQVVATMRSPEKETELTKSDNILVLPLDVTKPETIESAECGNSLARYFFSAVHQ